MASKFLRLDLKDLAKGLSVAVIGVVLGALQQMLTKHGFDFGSYDWVAIFDLAINAGGIYLVKNFLSDKEGKVLGKIG